MAVLHLAPIIPALIEVDDFSSLSGDFSCIAHLSLGSRRLCDWRGTLSASAWCTANLEGAAPKLVLLLGDDSFAELLEVPG